MIISTFSGCLKIGTSGWYLKFTLLFCSNVHFNLPCFQKSELKLANLSAMEITNTDTSFPMQTIITYSAFFYDSTLQIVLIWDKDQRICPKNIPQLLHSNIFYNYSGTPLKQTPLRPPLRAWHMEVSASGILPVGKVMCFRPVEHKEVHFQISLLLYDVETWRLAWWVTVPINARSLNLLEAVHNLTLWTSVHIIG